MDGRVTISPETQEPELRPLPEAYSEDRFDLIGVLARLAPHRRWILRVTFIAAVVTALLSLLLSNRYTATTVILPPKQQDSLAMLLLQQLGPAALGGLGAEALGLKNPNDIYVGMLRSRTIQDALIAKFKLGEVYEKTKPTEIREALASATYIRAGDDGLITIEVEDKDPKRAADMANGYVDELRSVMRSLAVTEAGQRRLFYEQQLAAANQSLAAAEVELREVQKKTGVLQLDSQAKGMIDAAANLRAQIAIKSAELQSVRSYATENAPEVQRLRQQIGALNAELRKMGGIATSNNPLDIGIGNLSADGVEYVRKLRELKYRETLYGLLAEQYAIARLDEATEGAVMQVLDKAVVPDKKSSPARSQIVILVAMLTFFACIGYVLGNDALQRMKADPVRGPELAVLEHHLADDATLLRRVARRLTFRRDLYR